MRHGGGRGLAAPLVAIVAVLAGIAAVSSAEPDGWVRFTPAWSEPAAEARAEALRGPGVELRLDITPYDDLDGAILEVRVPDGVEAIPRVAADAVRSRVEADGTTVWTVTLGDLPARAPARARFDCRTERGPGAIATFTVRGRSPAGDERVDAVGIAIGRPGTAPRPRHGANEFSLAPLPDAEIPGEDDR